MMEGECVDCELALMHVKFIVGVSACEADKSEAVCGWCVREGHGAGLSTATLSACIMLVYNTPHTS